MLRPSRITWTLEGNNFHFNMLSQWKARHKILCMIPYSNQSIKIFMRESPTQFLLLVSEWSKTPMKYLWMKIQFCFIIACHQQLSTTWHHIAPHDTQSLQNNSLNFSAILARLSSLQWVQTKLIHLVQNIYWKDALILNVCFNFSIRFWAARMTNIVFRFVNKDFLKTHTNIIYMH